MIDPQDVHVVDLDLTNNRAFVEFTVDVQLAPNQPPVAVDDAYVTDEDTPVDIDVLTNDTDADGDLLSVSSVTQPANGSVVINPDDTLTYTPVAGFTGEDNFTYTVNDGNGGSALATVNITVSPAGPATPVSVDDYVSLTYGRMGFDRRTGLMYMDVIVTNTSAQTISGPIQLVLEGISTPDVTLVNSPDGQTSDGKDYLDLTDETGDGSLDPGESVMVRLYFSNPFRWRFTVELGVRGVLS
jgi:hypothetical protein